MKNETGNAFRIGSLNIRASPMRLVAFVLCRLACLHNSEAHICVVIPARNFLKLRLSNNTSKTRTRGQQTAFPPEK